MQHTNQVAEEATEWVDPTIVVVSVVSSIYYFGYCRHAGGFV